MKYRFPDCLREQNVDEAAFLRWLHRKAQAHVVRDRERGLQGISVAKFKEAILRAVVEAEGRDYYTRQLLDWHLISTWDNVKASQKRAMYKREFWNLATIDHDFADRDKPVFHLCSWRLNDSKGDQTIDELLALTDAIRAHQNAAGVLPLSTTALASISQKE